MSWWRNWVIFEAGEGCLLGSRWDQVDQAGHWGHAGCWGHGDGSSAVGY